MPYSLEKRGNKWCVVGPSRTHGCHDSRADAIKQQRALYVNAPESTEGDETMSTVELPGVTAARAAETMVELAEGSQDSEMREPWEGILGIEGSGTEDGRIIELNEIGHRDLPVPFHVQTQIQPGHDTAECCGRIETIERIPITEFERRTEFDLSDTADNAIIIWGTGTLDGSEHAEDAKRMLENGAGVSLDGLRYSGNLWDKGTLELVDITDADLSEVLSKVESGEYLRGVSGDIAGVTVVGTPAYKEAKVLVASAQLRFLPKAGVLLASAAPVKPPKSWFENPNFKELTPLTITKEGRVYGHLADWDGCHVGLQGVCVPPYRSTTDYAYFNTGALMTEEGEEVTVGKIMFCMKGNGHAPEHMSYMDAQRYYDDATKVGAFVHAGSDRHGTWLAGSLRPGLTEIEVQHLRSHPPSGDWRPIRPHDYNSELLAALCVPIGGFPIARRALVASADGAISAIITAPLQIPTPTDARRIRRQRELLSRRLRASLGPRLGSPERIRKEVLASRDRA